MTALPGALLLVTDRRLCARPLVGTVRAAVEAGVSWVWLRDRDLDADERSDLARALRDAIGDRAALTIGANLDLARELGAAGVHLPAGADVAAARASLGPQALIGISAHGYDEARAARGGGASYVTLSPIFPSPSKPGYGPALGLTMLARTAALGCPVMALGGVRPQNARDCLRAGAAGLAVMGSVLAAADPAAAVANYLRALEHVPEKLSDFSDKDML